MSESKMSALVVTSKEGEGVSRAMKVCNVLARQGDVGLLFVGDGVYSLLAESQTYTQIKKNRGVACLYACLPDIEARGLAGKVGGEVSCVGYEEIVDLLLESCGKVVSYI